MRLYFWLSYQKPKPKLWYSLQCLKIKRLIRIYSFCQFSPCILRGVLWQKPVTPLDPLKLLAVTPFPIRFEFVFASVMLGVQKTLKFYLINRFRPTPLFLTQWLRLFRHVVFVYGTINKSINWHILILFPIEEWLFTFGICWSDLVYLNING